MVKRFTDSNKFRDTWYRKLSPKMKCLWEYLLAECSIAGIIDFDFDSATFHIGEKITQEDISCFGERVYLLPDGKYFIPKFIEFQQGCLNRNNPAHKNIISIIEKYIEKYDGQESSFEGAFKELQRVISNSISKSNSKSNSKEREDGLPF